MSTRRSRIQIRAIQILRDSPDGLSWTDLLEHLHKAFPGYPPKTIEGSTWDLDEKFPSEVYKPERGHWRHVSFKQAHAKFHRATITRAHNSVANLIILGEGEEPKNLNETEIHPEENVEKLVFDKSILPDVFPLKRQLPTYSKEERLDVVGVDDQNRIVVIEIKDETVDEKVIPQIMGYAGWVETHPDAIKSIWLENRNKPEDLDFDWEKQPEIRIVVIGPSFKPSVGRLIQRIEYPVDLIEFKKFSDGSKDFIFVSKIVTEDNKPAKPVDTNAEYDLRWYKTHRNPKSAVEFWQLADNLEGYVKARGWNLTRNNNRGFVSFKYGFPQVFGITFIGSKSFCLFFKVPKSVAKKIRVKGHKLFRYRDRWNQAQYKMDSGSISLNRFGDLFEAAYKNITGT